jgi:hypothetical protein
VIAARNVAQRVFHYGMDEQHLARVGIRQFAVIVNRRARPEPADKTQSLHLIYYAAAWLLEPAGSCLTAPGWWMTDRQRTRDPDATRARLLDPDGTRAQAIPAMSNSNLRAGSPRRVRAGSKKLSPARTFCAARVALGVAEGCLTACTSAPFAVRWGPPSACFSACMLRAAKPPRWKRDADLLAWLDSL